VLHYVLIGFEVIAAQGNSLLVSFGEAGETPFELLEPRSMPQSLPRHHLGL